MTKNCEYCGKEFEPTGRGAAALKRQYCSSACWTEFYLNWKQNELTRTNDEDLETTIEKTLKLMSTNPVLTKHHMKKLKVIAEAIKFLSLKAKKGDKDWGSGLGEEEEKEEENEKHNGPET